MKPFDERGTCGLSNSEADVILKAREQDANIRVQVDLYKQIAELQKENIELKVKVEFYHERLTQGEQRFYKLMHENVRLEAQVKPGCSPTR